MQAIKELEFGELEEPLKEYLDQVRPKTRHVDAQDVRLGPQGWLARR